MPISDELFNTVGEFEGKSDKVYPDHNGSPTIGYGHKLTQSELSSGKLVISGVIIKFCDGLTDDQIRLLLTQDLQDAENAVIRLVKVPLSDGEFDALIDFTFNCGSGALAGSTLLKLLNAGDYDQIPGQLRRWVHDHQGNILSDLVRRRDAEVKMWKRV